MKKVCRLALKNPAISMNVMITFILYFVSAVTCFLTLIDSTLLGIPWPYSVTTRCWLASLATLGVYVSLTCFKELMPKASKAFEETEKEESGAEFM